MIISKTDVCKKCLPLCTLLSLVDSFYLRIVFHV